MTATATNNAGHLATYTEFAELPLGSLTPHPLNRKDFDPIKMGELKASIAKSGILTLLLVRPNGKKGGYQILAGERRYMCAQALKLATVPCRIKDVSDEEAIEFMLVENLQRDDVHPLDQAQGFAELLRLGKGYTPATIGEKIGQSTKYVYDRIKLLQLTPEAKKLFRAGRFTAGHAIILARLGKIDQDRALTREFNRYGGGRGGLWQAEAPLFKPDDDDDVDEALVKPVTVREFQGWVDENVRFDPTAKDVPDLFPETAKELARASESIEKVVHITYEYQLRPEHKLEQQRTYVCTSWKRADGKEGSKACAHAVTGIIVIGAGRGEAFRVCIEKEKCDVHWKEERKRRQSLTAAGKAQRTRADNDRQRREAERQREQQEQQRWKIARPKLLEVLAARLKTMPAGSKGLLAKTILGAVGPRFGERGDRAAMSLGPSAEDVVRYAAFLVLCDELGRWNIATTGAKLLKSYGVDARKIVDQAAPKVQTSAQAPETKKGKAKR